MRYKLKGCTAYNKELLGFQWLLGITNLKIPCKGARTSASTNNRAERAVLQHRLSRPEALSGCIYIVPRGIYKAYG